MKSIRSGGNGSAIEKGSMENLQEGEDGEKNNVSSNKKEKRRNLMETLAQP
jgi:hypothetical protein